MKKLLLLLFMVSPMYSSYIDTRDMTSESLRVQRLLIQLDSLKITPTQTTTGINGTKIAMLSMMTAGLAVTASSGRYYGYRPPVVAKPYHYKPPVRPHRHHNKKAAAIGTTLAVMGAIGLAASEAAEERERQVELQRQATLQKIETELNIIISNLVSTDIDFIEEDETLNTELSKGVDRNILEIARITSNDIAIIINKQKTYSNDFVTSTNNLTMEKSQLETQTMETIQKNIDKMNNSSKITVKELQNVNKVLTKQLKTKQKEFDNKIKKEVKHFNDNYHFIQEQTQSIVSQLQQQQNDNILKEVEIATNKRSKLFQTYINRYIHKLAAY